MRKETLYAISCLLILGGCHTTPRIGRVTGVVADATMNTVTIVRTEGDTLSFSTMDADRTELNGLLIGDSLEISYGGEYNPGIEALKLSTVGKAPEKCPYMRLFDEGVRVEAADGSRHAMYILFSLDSLKVTLYTSNSEEEKAVLERRVLPSGEYVWNVEDDDTKNVRLMDGVWTVSQRGKLLFKQQQSDADASLGGWIVSQYEGTLPAADCPGIRYRLNLRHREHSGDGWFLLQQTYLEAEDGKDVVYTCQGKRLTQRGTPDDSNATVWQLLPDGEGQPYNFLYENNGRSLTLLNSDFKRNESSLNFTLNKVE